MSRTLALCLLFAAAAVCLAPDLAGAHPGGGPSTSNYASRLLDTSSVPDGVDVRLVDLGDKVELTNRSGAEVVVLGYANEAYLRFDDNGVWQNQRSPATYSNQDRFGVSTLPVEADSRAEPAWEKVSDGDRFEWYDHRIHWMSTAEPAQVQAARNSTHVLYENWEVPMLADGTPFSIAGDLRWVPPPSASLQLWLSIGSIAFIGLLALRSWSTALVAGLAIAVSANIVHVFGRLLETGGSLSDKAASFLANDVAFAVAWFAGVLAVLALRRSSPDVALFAALFAGAVLSALGGLADLDAWWASQITFAGPSNVARSAISLALGSGVAVVAVASYRLAVTRHVHDRSG